MLNIFGKKSLVFSAIAISLAGTYTDPAIAQQVSSINVSARDTVTFVVSGLSNANGWGSHFSSGASEDGYGGSNAECHLTAGSVQSPSSSMTLFCFDGYKDSQNAQNWFRLDLGPKKDSNNKDVLSHITITVSRRAVDVQAVRIATNLYNNERKAYTISTSFPIREESGFFKTGTIFYKANGTLSNTSGREGNGYILETSLTNPIAR
jgi:hypothetical protein